MTESQHDRERWVQAMPVFARREDFLTPRLGPTPLLDVGCIDERKPERIATSLHAWLRARCSEVHGIDADPRAVKIAAEHGFAVRLANAEHDALGGPYAVIVAGEIIEHVSDVGRLLTNLREHLRPDGRLLLTTPNPFSFRQVSKVLRKGAPQVHMRHTAWLDPFTLLEAAERSGLSPVSGAWFLPATGWFTRWLARRRPYGCESFGLEFAKNSAGSRETSAV